MDDSALNKHNLRTPPLDFSRLAQLKESARSDEADNSKEVAQQFESLFVNMMLQAMRKATNKSELLNSQATQTYEQLFDQEIANSLSKTGSFGIAEAIERQIQIARGSDPTSFKFPASANVKQNLSFNAEENNLIPSRQRSQLQLYKEAK